MRTIHQLVLSFLLIAFSLTTTVNAQSPYSPTDVRATVNYSDGSVQIDWLESSAGITGGCNQHMTREKIYYRVGTSGSWNKVFENVGYTGSSALGYATLSTLPGAFFTQTSQIRFEGDWRVDNQNLNTCGGKEAAKTFEYTLNNRVGQPKFLDVSFDKFCDKVELKWEDGDNVGNLPLTKVSIFRKVKNSSSYGSAIVSGIASNIYSDATAVAGTEYTYKIQTYMDYPGRTAYGDDSEADGKRIGSPTTPSGVFLEQATCDGQIDVNWNWSESVNPSNFLIERSANSSFTTPTTITVSGSDRKTRDANTSSGNTYYYRVKSKIDCPSSTLVKVSSPSTAETIVGLGIPPAPTVSATSINASAKEVTVTWVDNSNMEDGFKVVRQSANGQVEFDVAADATSYVDNSADVCSNFTYKVKSYNSCKTSGVISANGKSGYIPADIQTTFDTIQNKIESSDGEFGDRIQLKWKTPNRQNDNWNIYRIDPILHDTTFVASPQGRDRVYSDNTANANTLYEYLIEGETNCAGNVLTSNYSKDIGFRLAFGTVNGQVTYDGGTAVEGVKVTAEAASGVSGKSGGFNGTSSYANALNPPSLQVDSMSIVSFIRPANLSGKKVIASKRTGSTGWEFFLDGSTLKLTAGNKTISATSSFIAAANWFSVGGSVSGDTMKLYVNGQLITSTTSNQYATNTSSNLLIGKSATGDFFNGQIDDLRFYNRALSDLEMTRTYDVYINPSMDGLVGYWRFDEGFGTYAYDYSKTLLTPNKNHAKLIGVVFNNSKPSSTQLSAGAYTDERGSYFIPFIPYLGNGDNFIITPSFGTHTFTPATTTLFIGGTTPNFSAVNFTDNSSFTVTGSVKFANSTCFVKDIFILVDGEVVIQNGVPVQTDADGLFSLQVPIGPHVITAEKQNHTFSVGRFPATGNYNFQQNEALNSFIDNTLLKVVGRVAGGGIQASVGNGFGRGKNNIGSATIRFVSQQGGGCMDTVVTTDAVTGEYSINLPPMKFTIPDFSITSNNGIQFKNNSLLDLSLTPPLQTETDTLFKDSVGVQKVVSIDSSKYNTVLNFIHYNSPSINVLGEDFDDQYGSDSILVKLKDTSMIVPSVALSLRYPIFEENQLYVWQIQANEIYENRDAGLSNIVYDSVPLTNGKFIINNQLAVDAAAEFTIRPQDNFNGTQTYRFNAGQANTSRDNTTPDYSFSKTFELTLVTPNSTVIWEPNLGDGTPSPVFRGVIFGGRALGNSFATSGPQVVTMILRDPPGSNSFSSWEKDVTNTSISTFENSGGIGVNIGAEIKLGTKFSVGLGYTTETEIEVSAKTSTNIETSITGSNELVESVSRSVALNTSADPEYVGPDADIFFGRSLNMDFGLSQVITLIDTALCGDGNSECFGGVLTYGGRGFKIGSTKTMFTIPGGYGTEFVFTQAGIEGSVIPKLEALRNQLLASSPQYTSKLSTSHPDYGKSNDHPDFIGVGNGPTPDYEKNTTLDSLGESYHYKGYRTRDTTVTRYNELDILKLNPITKTIKVTTGVDSVWWYNQQIKLWQDAIARNEREKVLANGSNLDRNISYQAGAGLTYTNTTSREETESMSVNFSIAEELALTFGFEIGGNGVEVETGMSVNYSHTTSNATTQSTTTAFSYTIDDSDGGDEFTVDVFESKDGYGPIFKTRGGQTACPYQGETQTKYYRPGTVIDKATIQLEQPRITSSPATVFNVPANSAGVITLNLINDGPEDNVYDLKVLENTNPNGAILKIDGISPNRGFAVPAGTSISKQLQIEKGPNHIHYDSIALVFHSQCQYAFGTANYEDIADTVYVSVQFLPSCTDIEISSPGDQFVLNNDFNSTLPIILSGYDINYGGLEKIGLQYKPSAQSSWVTLGEEWFKDTTNLSTRYPNHPNPLRIPTNQSYITYDFDMAQLIDQTYQLRSVATCKIPGNPDKDEYSTVVGGVADRVNPHPFGTPSPADGVLDPNDDISIQFNEPIEAGSLTIDNFQLTGVVNGQELRHDKVVSFDGTTDFLELANGFDFASQSFTVEFWAKRNQLGTKQTVISQGTTANNQFAIGFNTSNQVEVTIGNQTYASSYSILDDTTWHHYSVIYDKTGLNLDITDRSSSANQTSTTNNFFTNYISGGKTYFGKSALSNSDFYSGSAHQIRIWNRALTPSTVASRLNVNLTGREPGLIGYWPMEEGRGDLAKDVARSRNAQVFAQWEISPKSSSAFFDGIDDYALLDSAGTLAASFEMDLTIEFWFKTSGGSPMTFLSNGSGRFTPNDINRNGWSIELAANNTIRIKNDSVDFEGATSNFADNKWHHFALVVNRLANTTVYVDGLQQNSISSENFYGFGAPRLAVGARYSSNGINENYDRHFSGFIDEVRIWNSARLRDNLELDMFNRLKGNEFGLIAYYPFERYEVELGVAKLTPSFKDVSPSLLNLVAQNGASITSNESPAVALQRPVKNINFTWSVNNDKIVINTNEAAANIENVTLNIAVKNVRDLRGNTMQSPKTWIAYINKNQVLWQDVEKSLTKELNDTLTFTTRIVNNGGEVKNFTISNIPAWLTVTPSNGTITPLSTQLIRFSVNPSINIGDYKEDIILTTDFGYNEKFLINLKVNKQSPNFFVDPTLYQKSMNVIGQIRINNTVSTNPDDKLVAFINGEVRGVANLQYMEAFDKYVAFLDVYSNTSDSVHFQIWNASKGELHTEINPVLYFVDNQLVGSPFTPQMFDAFDNVSKPIILKNGWNWVSFPLYDNSMSSLANFFNEVNFSEGDMVKTIGNNAVAQYSATAGWAGSLLNDGIKNDRSYLIKISQDDTLNYKGFALDPDTVVITVDSGWNRIGFVSLRNMQINTALANYNAQSGDIIKAQGRFSYYTPNLGWVGSLQVLEPTKGYLLSASASSTFVYPRLGLLRSKANVASQAGLESIVPSGYSLDPYKYEASTGAIVSVEICEEVLSNENIVLAAFSNGELRGITESAVIPNAGLAPQFYLTAYGVSGDQFTFALIDTVKHLQMPLSGNIAFAKNNVEGTPDSPIIFTPNGAINCDLYKKVENNTMAVGYVYPNPFNNELNITVPSDMGESVEVSLVDGFGRLVHSGTSAKGEMLNWSSIAKNNTLLPAGIYYVRFAADSGIKVEKIVKY